MKFLAEEIHAIGNKDIEEIINTLKKYCGMSTECLSYSCKSPFHLSNIMCYIYPYKKHYNNSFLPNYYYSVFYMEISINELF